MVWRLHFSRSSCLMRVLMPSPKSVPSGSTIAPRPPSRTPRAVTRFMVERTNPRLGELIFDPACGTGGFLTCALDHIRQREVKSPADQQRLQDSIRGVE